MKIRVTEVLLTYGHSLFCGAGFDAVPSLIGHPKSGAGFPNKKGMLAFIDIAGAKRE